MEIGFCINSSHVNLQIVLCPFSFLTKKPKACTFVVYFHFKFSLVILNVFHQSILFLFGNSKIIKFHIHLYFPGKIRSKANTVPFSVV